MPLAGRIMELGYRIVLASNSPRRRELLNGLGLDFQVRVLDGIDESYPESLDMVDIPLYISKKKAEAYRTGMADDELIITADTVVAVGERILGKPADNFEAADMLRLLSGRSHHVVTGVTLMTKQKQHSFTSTTEVWFSHLSEEEIEYYVQRFHPLDKAGAYGIQEWIGFVGVERIEGSYFNVVGLPIQKLYRELLYFCQGRVSR